MNKQYTRAFLALWFAALCLMPIFGQAGRPGLVLLPFEAMAGVSKPNAETVSEIVRSYIVSSNEFIVFENQAVNAILDELRFSSALTDIDVVIAVRKKLNTGFVLRGSVSKNGDSIIVSVRLIDADTFYIVFNKVLYTKEETITRDIRLFSEEISNESVALTVGITLENLEKLLKLGMLDEAYRKLLYYKQKYPQSEQRLHDYERRLRLALSKRAYESARRYAALAKKNPGSAFTIMQDAYFEGRSALFWVPDGEESLRKEYIQFMSSTVMQYFFDHAARQKQLVVKKSESYLAANPQKALEIILEYLDIVGLREVDSAMQKAIQKARARIADNLYKEAAIAVNEAQFSLAEQLINRALEVSDDYRRYAKEYAVLEDSRRDYYSREQYEKYRESPLWDPAAVYPYAILVKTGLVYCDKISYAVPFGGVLPIVEADFVILSRANDALVFRQTFALQYGSADWSGMVIDAQTRLGYSLVSGAWLPGFSGFFRDYIITVSAGPALSIMRAEGAMTAYGIEHVIDIPFGLMPMLMLRVSGEYAVSRMLSLGVDYTKTWGWLLGSGYMGTTGLSLYATVAW